MSLIPDRRSGGNKRCWKVVRTYLPNFWFQYKLLHNFDKFSHVCLCVMFQIWDRMTQSAAGRPVMVVTSSWVLRTRPSFGCRLPQHDFVFVFVCVFVFVFLSVFVFVFVYDFVTSSCCVPGQASGVVCHNMRDISNKMLSSPCHARIFTPLPLFESIFLSFCWHAMLLC